VQIASKERAFMKAYRLTVGGGIRSLELVEVASPELGPNEVRVRVRAVSLNFRDLMMARGSYLAAPGRSLVPASDAAGEVIAVGATVHRFKVGDRVATTFFPNWIDGAPTPEKTAQAPGGSTDGVLSQEIVVSEQALVSVPRHLDFNEAATLTCAGVTAWNALFVAAGLKAGDSVLLLGTGGVSIWGLQLAKASGLQAVITSSSDEKLARAKQLGADVTINYHSTPEWHERVLQATGGVHLVIEVGGTGTLKRSVAATRMGGTIAIVGGVSGFGGEFEPFALIAGSRRLSGIYVGSRQMMEDMNRLIEVASLRPVVDRVFPFESAREAYAFQEAGKHFGKVVIQV
jgi:NADPH:quinone reductase-like Zn-dependent oxidoreductase